MSKLYDYISDRSEKWFDSLLDSIKETGYGANANKDVFDEGVLIFGKLDVYDVNFEDWSADDAFNKLPDDVDSVKEFIDGIKIAYYDIWKTYPVIRMLIRPTLYRILFFGSLKLFLTIINVVGWFKFWYGFIKYEE